MLGSFYYRIRNNKTLVNGGLFSIYSFVNQGVSFLLLIVLAKYILPDDYGRLSLFNTIVMFLGYFMAFSSAGYLSVTYFKSNIDDFKKDFSSILALAFVSFFFFLLAALFADYVGIDFGFPSFYLIHAVAISFCMMIYNLFLDYIRIQEKVKSYGLYSCSNAITNFILSLFFVVSLNEGWIGRVNGQLVCYFFFCLLAFFCFYKEKLFVSNYSWQRVKTIVMWAIPLIPHMASIWIRQGGDRYIINYYHSAYDVGLFSFALNLTSIIIMIGMAFNQTNSVTIYQILSDKSILDKWGVLKKQTKMIFLINLIAAVVVTILICFLVPILLPDYKGSISYFLILSIYGFCQCIYFLVCNYLFYYEKTRVLMYITFSTSILHLSLSLIMTRYSLYLTCAIYIFIQCLICFLVFFHSKKLLKLHLQN